MIARHSATPAVKALRGQARRYPLHPLERLLLAIVAAHLVFLPWALGTMHVWSQCVSFMLSLFGFGVALLPRTYDEMTSGQSRHQTHSLPKLLRFPGFWLGLTLLGYILIQALNPAWVYRSNATSWWLERIKHIDWLPTGMDTPFQKSSPWRSLLIYGSAWMLVCALWIGFLRRRTFQFLFVILAINAFILALFGLAQRAQGADKIFWSWKPPASYFVSSFIYKNHAGAYFNLLLALSLGLFFWFYLYSQRQLQRSSPTGLFAIFATAIAILVFFSYSRTATALMIGLLAVAIAYFVARHLWGETSSRRRYAILGMSIALIGFLAITLYSLKIDTAVERISEGVKQYHAVGTGLRRDATQATWDMFRSKPITGWGAGCFRFYFPQFQRNYPAILGGSGRERMYWEHAHNDYVELLAELGCIGGGIVAVMLGFACRMGLQRRFWKNPLSLFIALGLVVTLVHSYLDFHFFNPAILLTWCVLWAAMLRWSQLDST